ncbi:hypothetical protein PENCOP_c011G06340 [Penicillium coprophilum]|uniref:Uncharacterized protein n=1 Tax=Penicillium coprophilum TaxID=36646 RepID=A0A1V6UEL6_9EURO|nr:hypothetical protein PENCOP_c011G06340 [Penicillium coprophilum]
MSTAEETTQSDIDAPQMTFERFYLHQSPTPVSIYHLLNDIDPTIWRFEHLPNQNIVYDPSLFGALKIGELDPTVHAAFLERLQQIPVVDSVRFRERVTCRVWLKEALFALDDEGYIVLTRSVEDIEAEARDLALRNKSLGRRTVAKSSGSQG